MRDYPVSKAQQIVLDALNLTATGHSDAKQIFKQHGIIVASKRVGRKSIPAITLCDTETGGFHNDDGWSQTIEFESVDLNAISQWIEK